MTAFDDAKQSLVDANAKLDAGATSVAGLRTDISGLKTKIDELNQVITSGGTVPADQMAELVQLAAQVDAKASTVAGDAAALDSETT